jgi:anhydro-N-acetylmuramic acid kinase
MLNMGGIANFTYLPSSCNPEDVFVTDTGTGNTLIDAFTRLHFPEKSYDKDAEIANQGTLNHALLQCLKADEFFLASFPKTTGPELFNIAYVRNAQIQSKTENITIEDLLATLTRFSAETIATAIQSSINNTSSPVESFTIYMSGGGAHNPLLVGWLKELLACTFSNTSELGISGDAKEAILFAILANETITGGTSDFGSRKGIPSVSMGKISFPS